MKIGVSLINFKIRNISELTHLMNEIEKLSKTFNVFELPLSKTILKENLIFNNFVEQHKIDVYFHSEKKIVYTESELLFLMYFYKKVKCKGIIIHSLECFNKKSMKDIIEKSYINEILMLENTSILFDYYIKKNIFKKIAFDIPHYLYLKNKNITFKDINYIHLRGYNKERKYERIIYSGVPVINVLKRIMKENNKLTIILEYPYVKMEQIFEDYKYILKEVNSNDV